MPDFIFVKPEPFEKVSKGGLILPGADEVRQRRLDGNARIMTVVAVGANVTDLKPGDTILGKGRKLLELGQDDLFALRAYPKQDRQRPEEVTAVLAKVTDVE